MRIIQAHEEGRAETFTHDERVAARGIVHNSVVTQMKILLEAAQKEGAAFSDEETAAMAKKLLDTSSKDLDISSAATATVIKKLWAEPSLKATFGERDRYTNLHDGASYFWDAIDRIYKSDYIPTEEDVLRTRIRTSGFEEANFTYKKRTFRVVDLGGQRSERRRWLEALQIATAVIFVSSLTEFDQRLREDGDSSRFAETKMLFTELLENSIQEKFIIVLLNKLDLFKTKMAGPAKQRFSEFFTDYKGQLQWEPCVEHIQDQFRHIAEKHKCRSVSVHAIVAIETDNVKLVWTQIRSMTMEQTIGFALGTNL